MLDRSARSLTDPAAARVAALLRRGGIRAGHATLVGLIIGLACAGAILVEWWLVALLLWLVNRTFDGLDGQIARIDGPTSLGGYLDFVADYVVYIAIPLAIAATTPETRLAIVALFGAYLINIVQLLTLSSIAHSRGESADDERALIFGRGLVEGSETIIAYVALIAAHEHAATIAWIFTALVLITAMQRFVGAVRVLDRQRD